MGIWFRPQIIGDLYAVEGVNFTSLETKTLPERMKIINDKYKYTKINIRQSFNSLFNLLNKEEDKIEKLTNSHCGWNCFKYGSHILYKDNWKLLFRRYLLEDAETEENGKPCMCAYIYELLDDREDIETILKKWDYSDWGSDDKEIIEYQQNWIRLINEGCFVRWEFS
jgi:hypothetical protein